MSYARWHFEKWAGYFSLVARNITALYKRFFYYPALWRCAENSKRSFGMDKNIVYFEELDKACREVIGKVLLTCEEELLKNNDNVKGLPAAALAVKESILTFLDLIKPE